MVSVVTQPPAPAGRKLKLTPSPVQTLAGEFIRRIESDGVVVVVEVMGGFLSRFDFNFKRVYSTNWS